MIKPNSERTPQRIKEITAAAGRASGAARRKRKEMRQAFDELLARKVDDTATPGRKITGVEELAAAMYMRAKEGDTKAFKLIAEITGEYQPQIKVDATADIKQQTQHELSPQQAREFLAKLEEEI